MYADPRIYTCEYGNRTSFKTCNKAENHVHVAYDCEILDCDTQWND